MAILSNNNFQISLTSYCQPLRNREKWLCDVTGWPGCK